MLIFRVNRLKYETFYLDQTIIGVLITIGVISIFWTIYVDLVKFEKSKSYIRLLPISSAIICAAISIKINNDIQINFDKSSLLKVFYDGGFNGNSIDFKVDGTYIFDNSAMGFSSFKYGHYKIDEDTISLDKQIIGKVIKTNRLIIGSGADYESKNLFQFDNKGINLKNSTVFRIVEDNR